MSALEIRRPGPEHRTAWDRLYAGYADFYGEFQDDAMRERVWSWVHDPEHELEAIVALDELGTPIGLAHYRPFTRPLDASTGVYLDDLFVDPSARGHGAGEALILALADEARRRGWTVVRWITADDNAPARAVYDRVASATPWVTYDLDPGAAPPETSHA